MQNENNTTVAGPSTVDQQEVDRFSALASEWWDPTGKFRPLHKFNPVRLTYIRDQAAARFGRDIKSPEPLNPATGPAANSSGIWPGIKMRWWWPVLPNVIKSISTTQVLSRCRK